MPTSSDGFVTVTVDPTWASVKVDINWGTTAPVPWLTTVVRTNPDGSKVTVRSGDRAYTPGGVGYVYDHESPLLSVCTYQAFGYDYNGAQVKTSTSATVTTGTIAVDAVWLKSLRNPSLSLSLDIVTAATTKRARPRSVFRVPGRPNPVVWEDVLGGRDGVISVASVTAAQRNGVRALLAGGGTVLVQFNPSAAVADIYASLGDDDESPLGPRRNAVSQWPLAYTEVDRPATAGSVLRVPGWTNDIVATTYGTYALWDTAFATYAAQSKGP